MPRSTNRQAQPAPTIHARRIAQSARLALSELGCEIDRYSAFVDLIADSAGRWYQGETEEVASGFLEIRERVERELNSGMEKLYAGYSPLDIEESISFAVGALVSLSDSLRFIIGAPDLVGGVRRSRGLLLLAEERAAHLVRKWTLALEASRKSQPKTDTRRAAVPRTQEGAI